MTNLKLKPILSALLAGATLLFTACKKDDAGGATTGQLNVEITDGPIDDPGVKGVFITVSEVMVDGQPFAGFTGKKTINLLAYQQGSVATLGLGDIEAGSYQNITLVLDNQTDMNGASPGCYVLAANNAKHTLSASASQTITAAKDFTIKAGEKTELVLDFDLRKAVQHQGSGADQYDFVATADLQSSLRVVIKNETGTVSGECQNALVNTDKIIVYAYKKGSFVRDVEIQSDNGGVAFKNAVTSTVVNSNGEFKIAFLEEGEYELHFAAYNDVNSDGQLDFQGTLLLSSLLDLNAIDLTAAASVQLNVTVSGILP